MKHCRTDYEAIQPWPTKRPHHADVAGERSLDVPESIWGDADPIIPDDEPVFILRAKDITAPEVVRYWAQLQREIDGGDESTAERVDAFADEMGRYAADHYSGGKVADTPHEWLQATS